MQTETEVVHPNFAQSRPRPQTRSTHSVSETAKVSLTFTGFSHWL